MIDSYCSQKTRLTALVASTLSCIEVHPPTSTSSAITTVVRQAGFEKRPQMINTSSLPLFGANKAARCDRSRQGTFAFAEALNDLRRPSTLASACLISG